MKSINPFFARNSFCFIYLRQNPQLQLSILYLVKIAIPSMKQTTLRKNSRGNILIHIKTSMKKFPTSPY